MPAHPRSRARHSFPTGARAGGAPVSSRPVSSRSSERQGNVMGLSDIAPRPIRPPQFSKVSIVIDPIFPHHFTGPKTMNCMQKYPF